MTKSVAVTGATGFIGRHLVRRLLDAGYQVRALTRRASGSGLPDEVTLVRGTLDDAAGLARLVDGAQGVVHCAGLIKAGDKGALEQINVAGTELLARVCADSAAAPRLIFLSSLAARHPELSDYGASKSRAERRLQSFGESLDCAVLRPPAVYGPGDRETLQFFRFVRRGYFPVPKTPGGRLSLVYVTDLCDAVVALLAEPTPLRATFEVRDPCAAGYTWTAIAEACGGYLGRKVTCVPIPRSAMTLLAAAHLGLGRLSGGTPALTPGKVRELYHHDWLCRDNGLTERTSWRPKVALDEGISLTLGWYMDNGWI